MFKKNKKFFTFKKSLYLCKLIRSVKMNSNIDTTIQFSGLKSGRYEYHYRLDGDFFKGFENEELQDGCVDFDVRLERQEHLLMFNFSFKGAVNCKCDRCLGEMQIPVEGEEVLCVKFSDTEQCDEEDVCYLPESAYSIDLAQWLYEYVVVAIPIVHIHPDDEEGNPTCDPEMLKYISDGSQAACEGECQESDPRWDALKALKNE